MSFPWKVLILFTTSQEICANKNFTKTTRCGPEVPHVGRPAKSRYKVWLTCTAGVLCSNTANVGECPITEFWQVQNSLCVQVLQLPSRMQETAKHRAKFGWLPLSDVGAVTKPRRETRWNLLGCPKLPPTDLSRYWAEVHHIVRTCRGDIAV